MNENLSPPPTNQLALTRLTATRHQPAELGAAFAQKYQAALQAEPDVVMAHQALRAALKQIS